MSNWTRHWHWALNASNCTAADSQPQAHAPLPSVSVGAALLAVFPVLTVVGNVMVVLGIFKEKMLKTNANYYILSLAIADINVAIVVMPLAIYIEVHNGQWLLSDHLCDIFVASDVLFSTASILNLTAICIDRFVAVTFPIEYAKQMTKRQIVLLILFAWLISVIIAAPVVCGLNRPDTGDSPEEPSTECTLRNPEYIIASSLGSFILPTCIVIPLYVKIFIVIRQHSASSRYKRKNIIPMISAVGPTRVVTHRRVSNHDDDHVVEQNVVPKLLVNDVSVTADASSPRRTPIPVRSFSSIEIRITSRPAFSTKLADDVANNESSSNTEREQESHASPIGRMTRSRSEFHSMNTRRISPSSLLQQLLHSTRNSSQTSWPSQQGAKAGGGIGGGGGGLILSGPARAMRRETKATLMLAIVLVIYLACWMPFFIVNMLNAFCIKTNTMIVSPLVVTVFVWLGYVNSALNPIIYGLFNTEYRKAFRKLICQRHDTPTAVMHRLNHSISRTKDLQHDCIDHNNHRNLPSPTG